jgi:hypothetical protein
MPGSTGPADHQQRMAAFGRVIGPEQDVEPEAPDPETFGRPQIMTRPGDTHGTRCQRLPDPILAELARVRWRRDGYDWSRIRAS